MGHIVKIKTDGGFKYKACYEKYSLAWASTDGAAARDNAYDQADNIQTTLKAVELAKRCNCKVFVGAGSQAVCRNR